MGGDTRFLSELTLTNFLSFGGVPCTIELGPLNVMVGPNGSGKSNLLEAITLLRAAPRDFAAVIRSGGGAREWLWKGPWGGESKVREPPGTPVASIEAVVAYAPGRQSLRHRISFTEVAQRVAVVDERIENASPAPGKEKAFFYFGYENGRPMLNVAGGGRSLQRESVDPEQSILAQRKDPDQYPEITTLGQRLAEIRVYREWSFGRASALRAPQRTDLGNQYLEEDCANLALVLNGMRRTPSVKKVLVDRVRAVAEHFDDFDTIVEGNTIQLFLQEGDWTVPATRLSDGTLRYLALLAILCHPQPPPLICIDEPELGLHPDLLPTVADLLRDAAQRTQLIVTTHSDLLVDSLRENPEALIVCEKEAGATRLRRPPGEHLRTWLETYSLGRLWLDGELGGKRW